MKIDAFNEAVKAQLETCEKMLISKGEEYALNADIDRLEHFKKAAAITGNSPKAALFGMLTKHLVSVSDMCMSGRKYSQERWSEKITDSINYLLILKAMTEEEADGQN